jgi:hypothetical protein
MDQHARTGYATASYRCFLYQPNIFSVFTFVPLHITLKKTAGSNIRFFSACVRRLTEIRPHNRLAI